jgi:tetratricopeptide (TPR) repeat protein
MRSLACLLLLGWSALAGPKAPLCVKNATEAVEIARTRGKLIFLTVIVDHDGENRAVIDNVFRDASFLKIAKEFVILYANNEDEHGRIKVKVDGKTRVRCRDCPSITCEDHMMLAQNFARGFFPNSVAKCPIHYVIDADQELVDTIMNGNFEQGFNHVPAKVVVTRLKQHLRKHGRGLTEPEYKKMKMLLIEAKAARARENVTLELGKLIEVVALQKKVEGVERAKARIREIDAIAGKELREIDGILVRKEWETALDALEKLAKAYPGTLSAAAATAKKKDLMRQKEVSRLLKARDLFEKGMAFLDKKRTELARKRLSKCVRLYKDTKYGQLAQKELAALPAAPDG